MKKTRPRKGVRMSRSLILGITAFILLVIVGSAAAEGGKTSGSKSSQTDYGHIEGKWLRPDGGYVLQLGDVKPEGQLQAAYFNPRSINVGMAEWQVMDDRIQVLVELQDVNYPGSTYKLLYDPEHDRLVGYYYQAVTKETFDVFFVRNE